MPRPADTGPGHDHCLDSPARARRAALPDRDLAGRRGRGRRTRDPTAGRDPGSPRGDRDTQDRRDQAAAHLKLHRCRCAGPGTRGRAQVRHGPGRRWPMPTWWSCQARRATVADLRWLRARGLDTRAGGHGPPIAGLSWASAAAIRCSAGRYTTRWRAVPGRCRAGPAAGPDQVRRPQDTGPPGWLRIRGASDRVRDPPRPGRGGWRRRLVHRGAGRRCRRLTAAAPQRPAARRGTACWRTMPSAAPTSPRRPGSRGGDSRSGPRHLLRRREAGPVRQASRRGRRSISTPLRCGG